MKSYRKQRMAELRSDIAEKHKKAIPGGIALIRRWTPIGTPETTGDPNYVITHRLWNSIQGSSDATSTTWGTSGVKYAPYVHQGTLDYAHGYLGWTEAEAMEFESVFDTGDRAGPMKGMKARPFLVRGLLDYRPGLIALFSTPVKSSGR